MADAQSVERLTLTMHRLRSECPWHAEQTHETLVPYLIEECYELVEAIEAGDVEAVREEAADVLYQVVFHSELLGEASPGGTELYALADRLDDKLQRRHPHVFGDAGPTTVAELDATWEQVKQDQSGDARGRSVLEGVPFAMPALALADKVFERAGRSGRVVEIAEVGDPSIGPSSEDEFGEALLALVADARAHGVNAERALRKVLRRVAADLDG